MATELWHLISVLFQSRIDWWAEFEEGLLHYFIILYIVSFCRSFLLPANLLNNICKPLTVRQLLTINAFLKNSSHLLSILLYTLTKDKKIHYTKNGERIQNMYSFCFIRDVSFDKIQTADRRKNSLNLATLMAFQIYV